MTQEHVHHLHSHDDNVQTAQTEPWLETYRPLLVIAIAALGAGLALFIDSGFEWRRLMEGFMGLFLLILALFKFFDIKGFAEGFALYDLAAMRWPRYAYAYPFIEAGLGLAYLAGFWPFLVNLITFAVMTFGAFGIGFALLKHDKKLTCVCLGTALKLPLGTVSLIENLGMGAMALFMLVVR